MNEYNINNSHSHPSTKMVPWLLLPHLPDEGVLLNVFYPNPNPETAFFQKKTKPNPNHTFYWHPFEFVHFLMHTHPTLLPIPTLLLSILLFDAFENVYYFVLHIMMAGAISICPFNCVCLEKYCHLGEGTFHFLSAPSPPLSLPPSLPRGEFLKSGAKM